MTAQHVAIAMAILIPLLGFHWRSWVKMDRLLKRYAIEHEILISDYCERKELDLKDLPTRHDL